MLEIYALSLGIIVACGIYMALDRHIMRSIMGLALVATAANFIIFLAGRLEGREPPIVPYGDQVLPALGANPLPQALVLTAIVIGFALTAFAVVLAYKAHKATDTMDSREMTLAEAEGDPFVAPKTNTGDA